MNSPNSLGGGMCLWTGSEWTLLEAPKKDSQGNPIRCAPDVECSLHVHGFASKGSTPVFSAKNAPGLILVTGNVGPYLSYDPNETNTYFSRDGGVTWEEISKGVNTFQFADHGAIMMGIRADAMTNFVLSVLFLFFFLCGVGILLPLLFAGVVPGG